jgi:hypothetical protein
MFKISPYWKGVIASAGPVLLTIQAAVDNGNIDVGEGVGIGTAVLIALGVIAKKNAPAPARPRGWERL